MDATQPVLVLFDTFRGQCTERILSQLEENGVCAVIIPANCMDHLQPLDLSVNKAAKDFLCTQLTKFVVNCNRV